MNAPLAKLGACGPGVRQVGATEAPAVAPTTLTLPAPPSVNALFRNVPGRGRVRTRLYDDWIGHAGWRLKLQRPTPVKGQVLLVIGIERSNSLADIDNRVKALLDLLVKHGVIEDDRHVVGLAVAWTPGRDGLARVLAVPATDLSLQFQLASDGATGGWFLDAPQPEGDA